MNCLFFQNFILFSNINIINDNHKNEKNSSYMVPETTPIK